jgi:uncharacterized protein (TIGR02300 family)
MALFGPIGEGASSGAGAAGAAAAHAEFAFDTPGRAWQLPPARDPPSSRSFDRVAKPEWGAKRICQSCGARFYDFHRSPITCPACGAAFDLDAIGRSRRVRPPTRAAAPAAGLAVAAGVLDEDLPLGGAVVDEAEEVEEVGDKVEAEEADEAEVEEEEEEDEESLIEDASELGEDDDDVGEVIDGVDDEGEPR